MSKLSHIGEDSQPAMVDISSKAPTARRAIAQAVVRLPAAVAASLRETGFNTTKGPVFATAIIAGTQAAKRTHELIPFCHPLGIEHCDIKVELTPGDEVAIRCSVAVHHRTGVEMEALTGASVAALTVYDMCKALSHDIVIGEIRLLSKIGGKSDRLEDPAA